MKKAHRVAWEVVNGPIPAGMFVLHRCDTPGCINSDHLFLGGHQENRDDCAAKGRHTYGEKHPLAKLTKGDVLAIRASPAKQADLARQYCVSEQLISLIIKRKTWKHI
jgi:hypothetical protein